MSASNCQLTAHLSPLSQVSSHTTTPHFITRPLSSHFFVLCDFTSYKLLLLLRACCVIVSATGESILVASNPVRQATFGDPAASHHLDRHHASNRGQFGDPDSSLHLDHHPIVVNRWPGFAHLSTHQPSVFIPRGKRPRHRSVQHIIWFDVEDSTSRGHSPARS